MRDLRALNNCEVFKEIRAELISYHKNKKPLNTFNFFRGNEREIRDVADRVLHILLEHELVEKEVVQESDVDSDAESVKEPAIKLRRGADVDQLRGTVMYLVLNSQLCSEEMQTKLANCNPHCVHLLNQLPEPLSHLLTVSIIILCGLEQMLFEFLASGPSWLTKQYFDCLSILLGHLVPDKVEVLPHLSATLKAVTDAICQHPTSQSPMNHALGLLQQHLLCSESGLRKSLPSKRKRHNYIGLAIGHLLGTLLHTMQAKKQLPPSPVYGPIYALHSPVKEPVQTAPLSEQLRLYASKLLDVLQLLVQQVSVDVYMGWQEMPSKELLLHLQAYVCNQCQKLHQLLAEDELLSTHSIFAQLSSFISGAQTFEQCLESLTLGKLLSLLDGELGEVPEHQLLAAIDELLRHRSICFGSEECVESLAKHVRLLTVEHAELMMQHLGQVMQLKEETPDDDDGDESDEDEDVNAPYGELLRLALLPIFQQRCNIQEKLRLLHKRDELQLLRRFKFAGEQLSARRISFFNRLSYCIERFPWTEFLQLCYEDSEEAWLSLAQLAMKHRRYAALYWHIAARCVPHATHYVDSTVQSLLQDDQLIAAPNANLQLLVRLYELPLLLNGIKHGELVVRSRRRRRQPLMRQRILNLDVQELPYNGSKLQLGQDNYLSSLARGLASCVAARNDVASKRLLQILLHLPTVEEQIMHCTRKSLREQRLKLDQLKEEREQDVAHQDRIGKVRQQLQLAKSYFGIHGKLGSWRQQHWELISQLVLCMDQLRDSLENFDLQRRAQLDLTVEYYIRNVAPAMRGNANLQAQLRHLVESSLQHKHLWHEAQLATLLDQQRLDNEFSRLLGQACSVEAIHLLRQAVRQKLDTAVMEQLAQQANQVNTSNAQQGYSCLFKCYMRALRQELIGGAKPDEYPCFIEQILRAPSLRLPENLLAAVPNFKILLAPEGISSKSMIIQYVNQSLADK